MWWDGYWMPAACRRGRASCASWPRWNRRPGRWGEVAVGDLLAFVHPVIRNRGAAEPPGYWCEECRRPRSGIIRQWRMRLTVSGRHRTERASGPQLVDVEAAGQVMSRHADSLPAAAHNVNISYRKNRILRPAQCGSPPHPWSGFQQPATSASWPMPAKPVPPHPKNVSTTSRSAPALLTQQAAPSPSLRSPHLRRNTQCSPGHESP